MQTQIRIEESDGHYCVTVDGTPWLRSTSLPKAEEVAAFLLLSDSDPEIQLLK